MPLYLAPIEQHTYRAGARCSRVVNLVAPGTRTSAILPRNLNWCLTWCETEVDDPQGQIIKLDNLSRRLSDLPAGHLPRLRSLLDSYGVARHWITASTTVGELARYIANHLLEEQELADNDGPLWLGGDLDARLSAATTPQQRKRLLKWLSDHQVSTSGIGDDMTVREALHTIIFRRQQSRSRERLRLGEVEL